MAAIVGTLGTIGCASDEIFDDVGSELFGDCGIGVCESAIMPPCLIFFSIIAYL